MSPDDELRAALDPFARWRDDNGGPYPFDEGWQGVEVKVTDDVRVLVVRFLYTAAVLTVPVRSPMHYTDRWCYHSTAAAVEAAERWRPEVEREPAGWHRHPSSGRRRPHGDPALEVVAW